MGSSPSAPFGPSFPFGPAVAIAGESGVVSIFTRATHTVHTYTHTHTVTDMRARARQFEYHRISHFPRVHMAPVLRIVGTLLARGVGASFGISISRK
jgi:hypothetical protein